MLAKDILKILSNYSGISISELKSRSRKKETVSCRYVFFYVCYHNRKKFNEHIDDHLLSGILKRNRTTVVHALKKMNNTDDWTLFEKNIYEHVCNSHNKIQKLDSSVTFNSARVSRKINDHNANFISENHDKLTVDEITKTLKISVATYYRILEKYHILGRNNKATCKKKTPVYRLLSTEDNTQIDDLVLKYHNTMPVSELLEKANISMYYYHKSLKRLGIPKNTRVRNKENKKETVVSLSRKKFIELFNRKNNFKNTSVGVARLGSGASYRKQLNEFIKQNTNE